jgi:hypothetical protein
MSGALGFLLLTLAVWRITSLLHREDGPWEMFAKFRSFMGVYYDELSVLRGRNVLAEALNCFWCTSIYVAFPAAFLMTGYNVFIVWVALSAAAILLDEFSMKGQK